MSKISIHTVCHNQKINNISMRLSDKVVVCFSPADLSCFGARSYKLGINK